MTFGPDVLHDIRSVTKSVVGLLYGIALADGRVPAPDQPLLPCFPEYADLAAEAGRSRLMVEHALTMTLGLEWTEDVPYTSAANSEIAMEFAQDRYRFVLERQITEDPGKTWHYCGGASALIGKLIAQGTGTTLADFAQRALLEPIGVHAFEWMGGSDGVESAASGLRLAPRDLARIGQVVLEHGRWDGIEVVPASWIETMLQPRVTIAPGFEYGYQWYLGGSAAPGAAGRPLRWVAGMGNGSQRLVVVPELDLVVAISAGNYDAADQASMPATILDAVILAATER